MTQTTWYHLLVWLIYFSCLCHVLITIANSLDLVNIMLGLIWIPTVQLMVFMNYFFLWKNQQTTKKCEKLSRKQELKMFLATVEQKACLHWRIHRGFAPSFLNILWKWNNLVSVRPNYFIFMGYFIKIRLNQQSIHMNPLSSNPGSTPGMYMLVWTTTWHSIFQREQTSS